MSPLNTFLSLALLPLLASAQWATYLSNVLGSNKITLSRSETLNRKLVTATSSNWTDIVKSDHKPGAGHHVFFYFTDREPEVAEVEEATEEDDKNASVPDKINVKFIDAIYNLTASKVAPSTSVVWVNCRSNTEPASLCPLFLAVHYPQLWHVTADRQAAEDAPASQQIQIRRIPLANLSGTNVTSLTNTIENDTWKPFRTWTGPFNPLDGSLKSLNTVLYEILRLWMLVPNWLVALTMSLIGQRIAARFYSNPNTPVVAATKKVREYSQAKIDEKEDSSTPPPSAGPTTRSRRAKTPAS